MNDNGTALMEHSEAVDVINRGGAMQQVRTNFTTAVAVQRPRALAIVQKKLLEEARLAGEEFYYGWGAGDNAIEGPSVHLALAAARCYGNCAIDTLPVQETSDSYIFTASFIDLETGFTLTRQFRQSKTWTVYGKMDEQRKQDVRFQLGQSKAIRNVILNAMPKGLVDHAMAEAKAGVKQKIEAYVKANGIAKAVDLLLRDLAKVGVKEDQVLQKLGIANRSAIEIDHLVILRGDLSAIQTGQDRASDLYPASEAGAKKADEKLTGAGDGDKSEKPTKITPEQKQKIDELCQQLDLPPEEVAAITKKIGAKSFGTMTAAQAELMQGELMSLAARQSGE